MISFGFGARKVILFLLWQRRRIGQNKFRICIPEAYLKMSEDGESTENVVYGYMPNSQEPIVSKLLLSKLFVFSDAH